MIYANTMHHISQSSSNRILDAYVSAGADFNVATRPSGVNNESQLWELKQIGKVFTFQLEGSNLFLDAHETSERDYSVVTRTSQDNSTQRWAFILNQGSDIYTIQQVSSGRFLESGATREGFDVYTRTEPNTPENNPYKLWRMPRAYSYVDTTNITLQNMGNLRFLNGHTNTGLTENHSVSTQPGENTKNQRWTRKYVAAIFTIQQVSTGRYLDAYEEDGQDFSVVTRPEQELLGTIEHTSTQRWVLTPARLGNNPLRYWNIQQLSNGRFLDAHETSERDFSVVTRAAQKNRSQKFFLREIT